MALYGAVLLLGAIAYFLLTRILVTRHGEGSKLAKAIGNDRKGLISVVLYAAAIPLSFVRISIPCTCYALVAVMWLLPDRRIERTLEQG